MSNCQTLTTAILDLSQPDGRHQSSEQAFAEGADAEIALVSTAGGSAHCSLWWRQSGVAGMGMIGHYQASSAELASELLQKAFAHLSANGCRQVVGPMDGSTWRSYRFITRRGSEPLFFLEPHADERYVQDFLAAGMQPCARYYSAAADEIAVVDPRVNEIADRLTARGVTIRAIDLANLESELAILHALSLSCFSQNLFFSPISASEFCAMYRRLAPYLIPELILIAEQYGRPVGFVFCLPDVGGRTDTMILKSLARVPERSLAGLGNLLQAQAQNNAASAGYRRVIHALMHETNRSIALSNRYAQAMREYSLFGRDL